jgi:hypothetical protein
MSKKLLIAIVVGLLVVSGLVGLVGVLGPRFGLEIPGLVGFETGDLESCGSKTVLFEAAPMNIDKLTSIIPLGGLDPLGGHVFPIDHIYFFAVGQAGATDMGKSGEVDVFSPGDVQLTRVAYIEYREKGVVVDKDYSLYFKPCREVEGAFYHINSLSPTLRAEIESEFELDREGTAGQHSQKRFEVKTDIVLRAGDLIGKAGGTFRAQAFDFKLVDNRTVPAEYVNVGRWSKAQKHVVCPLDYYGEHFKKRFVQLLGDGTKQRSDPPVCGRIDQDVKGTVQGVWFAEETEETYPEDRHLSLVHDGIEPDKPVFSVGTSMEKSGLAAGLYFFDVRSTGVINRDFSEVGEVGRIYCYHGLKNKWGDKVAKVIMVELAENNTLRMEARSGLSCVGIDWAFSDRMTVFER